MLVRPSAVSTDVTAHINFRADGAPTPRLSSVTSPSPTSTVYVCPSPVTYVRNASNVSSEIAAVGATPSFSNDTICTTKSE